MNWSAIRVASLGLACLVVGLVPIGGGRAWGQVREAYEVEDFRVPEYGEAGQLKSQIAGERAIVHPDGRVELFGVTLEFYREGVLYARVKAEKCVYDREADTVVSESAVSLESESVRISGLGMRLNRKDETVVILDQSRVVLKRSGDWFIGR